MVPDAPTTDRFSETQRLGQNRVVRVLFVVEPIFLGLIFLAVGISSGGRGWPTLLIVWGGAGVALPVMLSRMSLRTRVTSSELIAIWAPFYRRRIPLSEIETAEPIRYSALTDTGGWGVKRNKRFGLILNVFGDRAVHVTTARKKLLLGTQRPDELATAILEGAIQSEPYRP